MPAPASPQAVLRQILADLDELPSDAFLLASADRWQPVPHQTVAAWPYVLAASELRDDVTLHASSDTFTLATTLVNRWAQVGGRRLVWRRIAADLAHHGTQPASAQRPTLERPAAGAYQHELARLADVVRSRTRDADPDSPAAGYPGYHGPQPHPTGPQGPAHDTSAQADRAVRDMCAHRWRVTAHQHPDGTVGYRRQLNTLAPDVVPGSWRPAASKQARGRLWGPTAEPLDRMLDLRARQFAARPPTVLTTSSYRRQTAADAMLVTVTAGARWTPASAGTVWLLPDTAADWAQLTLSHTRLGRLPSTWAARNGRQRTGELVTAAAHIADTNTIVDACDSILPAAAATLGLHLNTSTLGPRSPLPHWPDDEGPDEN